MHKKEKDPSGDSYSYPTAQFPVKYLRMCALIRDNSELECCADTSFLYVYEWSQ